MTDAPSISEHGWTEQVVKLLVYAARVMHVKFLLSGLRRLLRRVAKMLQPFAFVVAALYHRQGLTLPERVKPLQKLKQALALIPLPNFFENGCKIDVSSSIVEHSGVPER